jgi:isochorismate pyruvate lyase
MARDPQAVETMEELRAAIDEIDRALVALLAERAGFIDRAAALKRDCGWPARIEARVEQVIGQARAAAADASLDPELAEALWRRLVEWSIAREERLLAAAHEG